jgi:hypothetical protein
MGNPPIRLNARLPPPASPFSSPDPVSTVEPVRGHDAVEKRYA